MAITVSAFPTAANTSNGVTAQNTTNERHILDAQYLVTAAGPNNSNVVNSNALDLVQAAPYPVTEKIEAQLVMGGSLNAVNANAINVVIQHSNTNVSANFTNIAELANPIMSAVQNTGTNTFSNSTVNVTLPRSTRRFVRAQMTGVSTLGNASDATLTFQIAF